MTRYAIIIEKGERNYSAYCPDLPGVVASQQDRRGDRRADERRDRVSSGGPKRRQSPHTQANYFCEKHRNFCVRRLRLRPETPDSHLAERRVCLRLSCFRVSSSACGDGRAIFLVDLPVGAPDLCNMLPLSAVFIDSLNLCLVISTRCFSGRGLDLGRKGAWGLGPQNTPDTASSNLI